MAGPYMWTFTEAWRSWLPGQTIDPPCCLSVPETRDLIRRGILVRQDLYKPKKAKATVVEKAEAPPPAETAARTKRGKSQLTAVSNEPKTEETVE